MSAVANALVGEALKIVLPLVAERIASFAAEKEPEVKAYLGAKLGHASPLVDEVFQLLVEPGLVTIGGLLVTLGSAAPAAHPAPAGATAPTQAWPDYRDE